MGVGDVIGIIWAALTGNPIARAIGKAAVVIFGVLTMRALWRRDGAREAKAQEAVRRAKADREAHERMNNADLGNGATDGERIGRLRDFAAKHGNGQAKREGR